MVGYEEKVNGQIGCDKKSFFEVKLHQNHLPSSIPYGIYHLENGKLLSFLGFDELSESWSCNGFFPFVSRKKRKTKEIRKERKI
jgi:hypothetical protein